MQIVKTCKWCYCIYFLDYFPRHKAMSDGHLNKCKNCVRIYHKLHPNKKTVLTEEQKVRARLRAKEWVANNMQRHSKNTGKWAKKNLDKRREYLQKYRAKKLNNIHEPYRRQYIVDRDKSICYLCDNYTDKPQLDHVIPVSRGGADAEWNLRVACGPCNRKKHDKLLEEL